MKKGKISESVLRRSVLKYIRSKSEEVIVGAGLDCAFLRYAQEEGAADLSDRALAVSSQTISLPVKDSGSLAVYAAANNLAAAGARAFAVTLAVTLPEDADEGEKLLQELMRQADETCGRLGMQIIGGHTEVTGQVRTPVITATALGRACAAGGEPGRQGLSVRGDEEDGKHEFDIVMTKWIGLEGTLILAREKRHELLTRYPGSIIDRALGFEKYLPILPEAATALKSDVYAMHDVRSGGVFGALWELGGRMGVGLSIDLKKIPVKQETIELCEFFDLNPYEILSGGSLLLAVENGERLVERLGEQGILAAVIGESTQGNDRIIINGEEKRFLEPAKPDEILKVIY